MCACACMHVGVFLFSFPYIHNVCMHPWIDLSPFSPHPPLPPTHTHTLPRKNTLASLRASCWSWLWGSSPGWSRHKLSWRSALPLPPMSPHWRQSQRSQVSVSVCTGGDGERDTVDLLNKNGVNLLLASLPPPPPPQVLHHLHMMVYTKCSPTLWQFANSDRSYSAV